MSFSNSSRDDPLLILTFAHLLIEAARWGVTTANRDRDEILRTLNQVSGLCYTMSAQTPVSRATTAFTLNPNA